MAKKRRSDLPGKRGMPIWASVSIIAILAVVAVGLVYVALQQSGRSPENQGFSTINPASANAPEEAAATEAEAPVEEAPASEETAVSEEAAPASAELVAPKRIIALDGNVAVRSTVGECGAPGTIEFSSDAGNTWNQSASFAQTSATQVLRILPSSQGSTFVVALNAECAPQIYSTANAGQTWNAPVSAVGTWYLNPADRRSLGAPGGIKTINCDALSLSPVTDSHVGVLCADGTVITTNDGGASWSDPIASDGGLTLGYSKQDLLSVGAGEGCEGLKVSRIGTAGAGESIACAGVDQNSIASGDVALAQSNDVLLLWAGDNVISSRDGGQTWL